MVNREEVGRALAKEGTPTQRIRINQLMRVAKQPELAPVPTKSPVKPPSKGWFGSGGY